MYLENVNWFDKCMVFFLLSLINGAGDKNVQNSAKMTKDVKSILKIYFAYKKSSYLLLIVSDLIHILDKS
jgi:hypothetical protein